MKPTPEQVACIDAFNTERALRVNAYAGTGKTTTLVQMAKSQSRRRGVYLAFNKSIADDAGREFPRHVSCSTVHAMAFRAMRGRFSVDKMTGSLSAGLLMQRYGFKPISVNRDVSISPRGQGSLVAGTIGRFLRSGDTDITARHVHLDGALAMLTDAEAKNLEAAIIVTARKAWAEMSDPVGNLPLTHDGYLHLWVMSRPVLPGDFVFLDEAQDTNGIVLSLVRSQRAQIVAVGDRWQQLYEWRGAINAMTTLPADTECRLSNSWRFGPALAENASGVLRALGETVPLSGFGPADCRLDIEPSPNAILARSNAKTIGEVLRELDADRTPYLVGGTAQLLQALKAIEGLQNGIATDFADFLGFAHWRDVVETSEKPDGADLKQWVSLVATFGVSGLRDALYRLPAVESEADTIISTGHRSKGREWDTVRLCDDFLPVRKGEKDTTDAELMLYYVACTRARKVLDLPAALTNRMAAVQQARESRATCAPKVAA